MSQAGGFGSGGGGSGITSVVGGTNINVSTASGVATVNLDDQILQAVGSQAAPSYSFAGSPQSGLYSPGTDQIMFVIDNNEVWGANTSGFLDVLDTLNIRAGYVIQTLSTATDTTFDFGNTYLGITDTSAARTITLSQTFNSGRVIYIKDESGGALLNNITIQGSAGQLIDNQATKVINTNYGSVNLISRDNNWWSV